MEERERLSKENSENVVKAQDQNSLYDWIDPSFQVLISHLKQWKTKMVTYSVNISVKTLVENIQFNEQIQYSKWNENILASWH